MEITFLGVGEACDERYPNTSLLVYTKKTHRNLLLDCGFSVAHQFFKYIKDPDLLDIVWISHFHGDHFLGLPLLLLRFWEQGREKPLHFVGQKGLKEVVTSAMKLAFPTLAHRISFEYVFHEIQEGEEIEVLDLSFIGEYTGHSQANLGVRIKAQRNSLYYSGDGPPKERCYEIAKECNLIVQESFLLDRDIYGHGNFVSSLDFARRVGVSKIALIHMQRDSRDEIVDYFDSNKSKFTDLDIYIPIPGDKIVV